MFTRKRLFLCLAFAALAFLGIVALAVGRALIPPTHGITPEVTARIQLGMTPAEVEAIMGMPPGYYRPDMVQGTGRNKLKEPMLRKNNDQVIEVHEYMHWFFEDTFVTLGLDDAERVVHVDVHFNTPLQRAMAPWRRIRLPWDR